jgi:hypothetical protein
MLYHEGNSVEKKNGYIVLNEISTNQLRSWMVVQGGGGGVIEAEISKNYCATNSGSPEVELRF